MDEAEVNRLVELAIDRKFKVLDSSRTRKRIWLPSSISPANSSNGSGTTGYVLETGSSGYPEWTPDKGFPVWTTIAQGRTFMGPGAGVNTWFMGDSGANPNGVNVYAVAQVPTSIPLRAADYAVTGRTTQVRIVALMFCNTTAPGGSFRYFISPASAVTGGAGAVTLTVTAAETVTTGTLMPNAAGGQTAFGAATTIPADANYVICMSNPGFATAANHASVHVAQLQMRHV